MPPRRASRNRGQSEPTRRSSRTSRPPARADAPVSYALPATEEDDSSSDCEIIGSTSPSGLPPLIEWRELSVELLDGPPSETVQWPQADLQEAENALLYETDLESDTGLEYPEPLSFGDRIAAQEFLARMDDSSLTYDERIETLIAQIHRIETPNSMSPVDIASDNGRRAGLEVISSPVNSINEHEYMPEIISHPPTPDDSPILEPLYLVTVQTQEGGRTYVQILPALPGPDHTLITRLSTGMLGRILRTLDGATFFVGTNNFAMDVSTNYMHFSYNFRELGSLAEVQESTSSALSLVTPVLLSPTRSDLLLQRQLDHSTPVYAIYIYHQDVQSEQNPTTIASTMVVAPTVLSSDNNTPPSIPASTGTDTSAVNPAVAQYLRNRFQLRFERIAHAHTAPRLGQAYRHIMQEKHILAICAMLGLDLSSRVFAPVQVEGHTITYADVIACAGLKKKTFATARTAVGKAREARRLLAQLFRVSNGSITQTGLAPATATQFLRLTEILSVMLVESDIDERFLDDESGRPETEALTMPFEKFKADVGQVLETLRPSRSVS
ncbi:hypothetical protein B0H12DRAFT_1075544 [Mycena haematopus]|nr:hypothetical protein B0H12DRAFT_1075544 [Mycena haematopus]